MCSRLSLQSGMGRLHQWTLATGAPVPGRAPPAAAIGEADFPPDHAALLLLGSFSGDLL